MSLFRLATLVWVALWMNGCGKDEAAAPLRAPQKPPAADAGEGGGDAPGDKGSLFPLKVGSRWVYETKVEGASACQPGKHEMKVMQTQPIAGKDYFLTQGGACVDGIAMYYLAEGPKVTAYGQGLFLDEPAAGKEWAWTAGKFRWAEKLDSVTVPAGTFEGCWRREFDYMGRVDKDVFCPGVGLVRSEGYGYTAELLEYHQ